MSSMAEPAPSESAMEPDVHGERSGVRPMPTAPPARAPEPARAQQPYIVVVALDLSEPGGRAWRFAFDLAETRGEAEIHAVVVGTRELAPATPDVATPQASIAAAAGIERPLPPLKVLQHRSPGGQARLMALHYRTGRADRAILRLAAELGADLIVVATQPTTRWQRWLGGSIADRIARNAPCPVVVVRPKHDEEDPGVVEYEPKRPGA
jgi:nucleotide-binding universal stress UspA family protein